MTQENAASIIESFATSHVLVIGDVMLDRFVYGSIERISPEAPIPVIHEDRTVDMPGGAGNVVRNCAALGASVGVIGVVGEDDAGRQLRTALELACPGRVRLMTDPQRPTTVKTRFVADRQQVLRSDRESSMPVRATVADDLLAAFDELLAAADTVILSDYAKGVLTSSVTRELLASARRAGKTVLVDPKGRDFSKYRGATVLTPNRHELQLVTGKPAATADEVVSAAQDLLTGGVCEAVVVTRGPEGMTVVEKGQPPAHLSAVAREVFDVSGAGDTVIATIALCLATRANLVDAAHLGNVAAGLAVSKRGTAVVTPEELLSELDTLEGRSSGKVLARLSAVAKVRRWRERGLKVAFTNGCFDLLHPGHIALLSQARAAADKLVVGLNSDDSVRRLKGQERPVQTQSARAAVLASLECVDAVVVFDEETPLQILQALEPDVLVKGSDYSIDNVVGAKEVIARGGQVLLVDLVEGHSTTNTLRRVNTRANG